MIKPVKCKKCKLIPTFAHTFKTVKIFGRYYSIKGYCYLEKYFGCHSNGGFSITLNGAIRKWNKTQGRKCDSK